MNNRYLFKAKRIDYGKWTKGYYSKNYIGKHFIDGFEVDPSTLCPCTGLKDREKNLIWENDLVITPKEDGYSLICWNDTEAKWEMYNETEGIVLDFDYYWSYEIEVVGNRIDNPELLEVE